MKIRSKRESSIRSRRRVQIRSWSRIKIRSRKRTRSWSRIKIISRKVRITQGGIRSRVMIKIRSWSRSGTSIRTKSRSRSRTMNKIRSWIRRRSGSSSSSSSSSSSRIRSFGLSIGIRSVAGKIGGSSSEAKNRLEQPYNDPCPISGTGENSVHQHKPGNITNSASTITNNPMQREHSRAPTSTWRIMISSLVGFSGVQLTGIDLQLLLTLPVPLLQPPLQ